MSYGRIPEENQLIQADDDELDALSFTQPQAGPSVPAASSSQPAISGRIGQSNAPKSTTFGGVRMETRYTGEPTLDEPVSKTIAHLTSIYQKLLQVLYPPKGNGTNQLLRDWDLWGPLVICLSLAIVLSIDSPPEQSMNVFSLVISLVTIGSVVITVNSKLLGGKVSFFQSLCVLGYSLAPILLASVVSLLVHNLYVRIPVSLACWAWSVWASMNFFNGTGLEEGRTLLAVYPMCLFFFVLAWMIMIQ